MAPPVGRVPSGAENAHQFIPVPRNTSLTYDEWCEEFGRNHENDANYEAYERWAEKNR